MCYIKKKKKNCCNSFNYVNTFQLKTIQLTDEKEQQNSKGYHIWMDLFKTTKKQASDDKMNITREAMNNVSGCYVSKSAVPDFFSPLIFSFKDDFILYFSCLRQIIAHE